MITNYSLNNHNHKLVNQDMDATFGEDAPSNSMVTKCISKFKRGRKSLEDNPPPGRPHNVRFCQFFFVCLFCFSFLFNFQGLEGKKPLIGYVLFICNRKTRHGYSFKLSVYSSIE